MARAYIRRVEIENVGPIARAAIELQPLHALIGPNDTGKSSVLRALAWFRGQSYPLGSTTPEVRVWLAERGSNRPIPYFAWARPGFQSALGNIYPDGAAPPIDESVRRLFGEATQTSRVLRLDPDALRQPSPLITTGEPIAFRDDRGTGLPAIYDALLTRDLDGFNAINSDLRRLFPTIKALTLQNPTSGTKALSIKLTSGVEVGTGEMSEGLLYWLAYAALPYMNAGGLLLVEEPENGLHPARITDVMRVLKEISKTTQVVLATHSPLVINELQPEQVTVLTRDPDKGTIATPISQTPGFAERSKVYALGELWLSYSNGVDERPLLAGEPRP